MNKIVLYDDKIILTYNFKNQRTTISFKEIDAAVAGSETLSPTAPEDHNSNILPIGRTFGFCFLAEKVNKTERGYTFFLLFRSGVLTVLCSGDKLFLSNYGKRRERDAAGCGGDDRAFSGAVSDGFRFCFSAARRR
ncbi:MAG: hypothetical protein IKD72_03930 [Clostridia bacterium]|nr:hypothetical protein [Clostridia bacterium]